VPWASPSRWTYLFPPSRKGESPRQRDDDSPHPRRNDICFGVSSADAEVLSKPCAKESPGTSTKRVEHINVDPASRLSHRGGREKENSAAPRACGRPSRPWQGPRTPHCHRAGPAKALSLSSRQSAVKKSSARVSPGIGLHLPNERTLARQLFGICLRLPCVIHAQAPRHRALHTP